MKKKTCLIQIRNEKLKSIVGFEPASFGEPVQIDIENPLGHPWRERVPWTKPLASEDALHGLELFFIIRKMVYKVSKILS